MADYNQWMNRKIYAVCQDMPDEKRKENLGAYFQSIHGTLNHILYGDLVWMGRFIGQKLTQAVIGTDIHSSFDDLRAHREETDNAIREWVAELTPERLECALTYRSGIDGRTRSLPLWILVTHMFNHQTHHRGQLTTVLTQLGIDYGVTDIPWLPELEKFIVDDAG